jgi:hypothetical protein
MIRFTLDQLREKAAIRPPGYFEDVLALATVQGEVITLEQEAYEKLTAKYRGSGAAPRPQEPTATELAANFSSALARWSAAGFPVVSREIYDDRAAICAPCEFWDGAARLGLGKCRHKKCGCTKMKRWLATEKCPLGKWSD